MIAVQVCIEHVFDGLVAKLLHFRHDVSAVDLELVVDQNDTFIGNQCRYIAGHEIVVDHEEIVLDLDHVQFCGLRSLCIGRYGRNSQNRHDG